VCARLLGERIRLIAPIDLYAKIGYTDELKTLIATHADALFRSGQWQTLERWLSLLPAAVVESDGWLTYWQAVMKLSTSPADAQKCFEAAYQKFARLSDQTGQFLAAIGAIEAIFARVDSYLDLDEWIRVLEPHMFSSVPDR
jgi:ATP/maltotriose-dependent transcriptional regulator MalT